MTTAQTLSDEQLQRTIIENEDYWVMILQRMEQDDPELYDRLLTYVLWAGGMESTH